MKIYHDIMFKKYGAIMKKLKKIIYLNIIILFIASCASTPAPSTEDSDIQIEQSEIEPTTVEEPVIEVAPEPVEEPVIEKEPEPVEEPIIEVVPEPVEEPVIEVTPEPEEEPVVEAEPVYIPEPLDENLISQAKQQIFKAEEARAKTYYPERLQDLKGKLNKAVSLKESDPDSAREILKEIDIESEKLIKDSLEALKSACITILNKQADKLVRIKADLYTPEEFLTTQQNREDAIKSFDKNSFTDALALYRIAYTSQENLFNTLSRNISYIEKLLKKINSYKVEGERLNVEKWAPEEYSIAVDLYLKSLKLIYEDYNAIEGETSLRETIFYAKKAIDQAKINIEVAKTDEEIFKLMSELEEASTLTILDKDDNIISPTQWEGKAELKEKPIEAVVEVEEEDGFEPVELDKDIEVVYPELSRVKVKIIPGETRVLGIAEKRKSLLEDAKEFWQLGIEARNSGDLVSASEYLAKSKIYLDEYKSMAVDYIYTVVLNPERRDCLWRIAEKDEFYGDPFLWQNIWERNKKLIQDPDLIYPGWKLIIPPLN